MSTASVFAVSAALLAVVGMIPLSLFAYDIFVIEERDSPSFVSCSSVSVTPFNRTDLEDASSQVRVRVRHEGESTPATLCLYDSKSHQRFRLNLQLHPASASEVEFTVPRGMYYAHMDVQTALGQPMALQSGGNVKWCPSKATTITFETMVLGESRSASSDSSRCVPPAAWAGLTSLTLAGALFAVGKFLPVSALMMFTRLVRPRVLDHEVRSKVYELVNVEPGIHASGIVQSLDAGEGQTAYHLGVLVRERALTTLGFPGFRRYYVSGQFSPQQMRAITALRSSTLERVYQAVLTHPAQPLHAVAKTCGMTTPSASRAAKKLEAAGLVERHGEGRNVLLSARLGPADLQGSRVHEAPKSQERPNS